LTDNRFTTAHCIHLQQSEVAVIHQCFIELSLFAEIARDSLERTGKYEVIEGIISPVSDSYPKKVHYVQYFY